MSDNNSTTKARFEFVQTSMQTLAWLGAVDTMCVRIGIRTQAVSTSIWMTKDEWEAFKTLFRGESEEAVLTIRETKRYREAR